MDTVAAVDVAVVIPNFNGARWLPGVLDSVAAQTRRARRGRSSSTTARPTAPSRCWRSGSRSCASLALPANGGFARTANAGLAAVDSEAVALLNTDIVLAPDWLERAVAALEAAPSAAAVATKMVDLADPSLLYDAGDVLRRDGACEQRGRFERDTGRYDAPGEVFSACAGAALYRRAAVLAVGGFDERLGTYLEDVDLGLRLRLAAWRCRWEPRAVARHAGGGSSGGLRHGPGAWVQRNTLLLVARVVPRRAGSRSSLYRQLGWAWHAARGGELRDHLAGVAHGAPVAAGLPARAPRAAGGRRAGDRGGRAAAAGARSRRGRPPVAPCPLIPVPAGAANR